MRTLHFISGLPRSGSTLLAALLRQNPRMHARMSSPLAPLYESMLQGMSEQNKFGLFIEPGQRKRVLAGLFDAYYGEEFSAEVLFDTNRDWTRRISGLAQLFPRMKMLCMVRSVAWILDSFERLVQENPLYLSRVFGPNAATFSVYERVQFLMSPQGTVGKALHGLREAYYGPERGRILIVPYEKLAAHPARVMREVYEFIGEPPFTHDFEHVAYEELEFDARSATPGLHAVRPQVHLIERASILPPDLFRQYERLDPWN